MRKKMAILAVFAVVLIPLFLVIALRGDGNTGVVGKKPGSGAIGVIRVEGVIAGGQGGGLLDNTVAGSEMLMEQIKNAAEDDRIKVLLLRINSPGGSVPATQEVGDELDKLRKKHKKVVVSMGDVAASGGYWLAAKSDHIVANSGTLTGSIGVIMELQNLQELYKKIGMDPNVIKSGPHKDIGSTSRQLTPEERQILQNMVNDMYEQFVDVVATGRKMDKAKVRKLADGRIYTGRQAKSLGLVDQLGNYYTAIDAAKKLGGIKGEPEIIELAEPNPFAQIFGGMGQSLVRSLQLNKYQSQLELYKLLEQNSIRP